MTGTISVALGRFDRAVASGLRALIADDDSLRLVGAGVSLGDLVALAGRQQLDVAVIDLDALPSPRELGMLRGRIGPVRLVVLTEHPTPAECRQALAFGASACLGKDTAARDVLHAVHLATSGLRVVVGDSEDAGADDAALSDEEASVLALLREGRTKAETAELLKMELDVVRRHVRRISRKLAATPRRTRGG